MKQIRVLTLIPASYGGGAEQLVLDQIKYHNRNIIYLRVVSLRKSNAEEKFADYPKYFSFNTEKRLDFSVLLELSRIIKKHKVRLLHTHLVEADIYGCMLKILNPKIKWISTRHNSDAFRKKFFWRSVNKTISLLNHKIITVSKAVKQFIHKYEWIDNNDMIVLVNGVDTTRFRKLLGKSIRNEYGLARKDFVVGIVGRITEQKGHIFLMRAAKILQSKIRNLKILIVGQGELEQHLKEECKSLGLEDIVIFAGFRSDVENVYNSIDVFCLPSIFEGFGLVIAEAMLCDTITVASRIDGIKEVISDGETGFLVDPERPDQIAETIYSIYANPSRYSALRRNATKIAREKFDIRKRLQKLEQIYLEAAG